MKVNVILEHRFVRTPDGNIWTQSPFNHTFWQRYLAVFEQVCVVARVKDSPSVSEKWKHLISCSVNRSQIFGLTPRL